MPISFTDHFGLNKGQFSSTGAFDVILDVDSRLFIDPLLLGLCTVKEFRGAKDKVEKYFSGIITLLSHSKSTGDMYWKRADKLLTFTELTGTCFGYSQFGTNGNSIGRVLRQKILSVIKELIIEGENDPSLFELLGVFQEDIGCDRISDLLTFILQAEILSFTEKVISRFNLSDYGVDYDSKTYKTTINQYNEKPILLLPADILCPLPVAYDFDDIDLVCRENERVRRIINDFFDLGNRRKKLTKQEIYALMKSSASFREALLTAYRTAQVSPYDFESDPAGEYSWYSAAKDYVDQYPLALHLPQRPSISDLSGVVDKICHHFSDLIENHGLWSLLYNDRTKIPKHERAAQLLFYGIADAYCSANDIDLSREVDNGRGSVDFKLSRGASQKVLIEVKLTSNGQLHHGFMKQIPVYMKQEHTHKAVYLIIDNGHPKAMQNFVKLYNEQSQTVKAKIPFMLIDGTPPKSASKA